ncbi:MAG: hypothetical protein IJE84_05485, partial [Clostridia bacterium]|nr:hypothetical protein [Clostridia bacterium]
MFAHKSTNIALAVGIVVLTIWGLLGTGTSLAWFHDETEDVRNVFNFAVFDLDVEYRNHHMTDYDTLTIDTNVFGGEDLFEPGFTQVVYLKVKNASTVDMRYKLSVDEIDVTIGTSVYGQDIYLPNYLRYGVEFADGEEVLEREVARQIADRELSELRLNEYSEWDSVILEPGDVRYIAIVVYMPEEVDNTANYRG